MSMLHPGTDPGCPICFGVGAAVVREGRFAVARRCTCVRPCPHCGERGWIDAAEGHRAPRKRCPCRLLSQRIALFDHAEIPGRHARSTRVSFEKIASGQAVAMAAVTGWLNSYRKGEENRGLVLHGDVGRGKTHLMVALLRELALLHGVRVRFVEFSLLLADIKSGFDLGQGVSDRMQPLVNAEVLAIDELGKGRNTEFEGTVLDELISRRYNAATPLLATTNYAPLPATGRAVVSQADHATGRAAAPTLADRVGARVYSRLEESCDFVPVVGVDYRTLGRSKRTGAPR